MDNRILKLNFKNTLSALSDLMMPRVCLVCGRELTLREKLLCLPCSLDLPLTRFECLEHNPMADKYNARISVTPDLIGGLETRSEDNPSNGWNEYEPYQRATALLHYWHDSGYANIPQALKYGRDLEAGRYFGSMLGKRLRNSPLFADVDLVVPVPLHWTRHLRRGYNQAEILARAIARELSAALAPRLLRRVRRTRTQTRKTIEQKTLNVSGAFTVRNSVLKQFLKGTRPTNSPQNELTVRTTPEFDPSTHENGPKCAYHPLNFLQYARWRIKKWAKIPSYPLQNSNCVHTLSDFGEGMCKNGPKRTYPRSFSVGYARSGGTEGQSNGDNQGKNVNVAGREIHHILLVDDVFTTGSTLTECHNALRKVFGPDIRISLATLSFAG